MKNLVWRGRTGDDGALDDRVKGVEARGIGLELFSQRRHTVLDELHRILQGSEDDLIATAVEELVEWA